MTERDFGLAAIDDILRDSVTGRERHSVRWESFTDQFIAAISTAKVYVDCGAEYGFYVRLALKYGPPDIKIYAFEPEPTRYTLLKESFRSEPTVLVCPLVLADCAAQIELVKPAVGYSASATMHAHGERFLARAITLDSIIIDRVDVLKMDIEGGEDLAFLGMTRILGDKPTLFVEWHPADPAVRRRTFDLLATHGYSVPDEPVSCGRVVLT